VDLRTAVIVVIVLSTGYSSQPGLVRVAGARQSPSASAVSRPAWPDPDLRAGLGSASRIGVQARRPLVRPHGPRCPITKAVLVALDHRRADQVLLVRASGTRAQVVGCERVGEEYLRTLGPFAGRVGRNGVASHGKKREGDGRTPSGIFDLRSGFGTAKNPGLPDSFGWFKTRRADVWVDDSTSGLYNTHQVGPAEGRWQRAEKLRIRPYRTAQVIDYNRARTPGRGSAIFLHRDTGRPTAGCVSLRVKPLRAVMRWERAGAVIAIS
jgi:L,D-peptidoglycan transpeptidase YkuD (ErfK/YbiS/YcfS/YnhG family)